MVGAVGNGGAMVYTGESISSGEAMELKEPLVLVKLWNWEEGALSSSGRELVAVEPWSWLNGLLQSSA